MSKQGPDAFSIRDLRMERVDFFVNLSLCEAYK